MDSGFFAFLAPIEWAVAWIMYLCHQGLTFLGMSDGAGPAWVLSIVGLVVIIRILLIPLFFKQIKASRGMQMLQPEMQAIQKKYKGKSDPASREAMSRETMALYRKHGTNPFASCLPILLQSPIFFALFRVLYGLTGIAEGTRDAIGPIDASVASAIESSTIFGAPLSEIFLRTDDLQTRLVIGVLIVAMCATTFFTQRQLTMKNMPKAALEGPMAQTQKMMLYLFPLIFAISGVNFPVGVLIYWTTTNLWSMGQQFYTIRKMPAPGSQAEKALNERKARKAAKKGIVEEAPPVIEQPRGQRQQPKRKNRQKPQSDAPAAGAKPGDKPKTDDAPQDAPTDGPAAKDSGSAAPTKDAAPAKDSPSTGKSSSTGKNTGKSGGSGQSSKPKKPKK